MVINLFLGIYIAQAEDEEFSGSSRNAGAFVKIRELER